MAFTEEERKQWEPMVASFIEDKRPPEEIRPKLDIGYTIDNQSIIIYTLRPRWNRPEEKKGDSGSQSHLGAKAKNMEDLLATGRYELAHL